MVLVRQVPTGIQSRRSERWIQSDQRQRHSMRARRRAGRLASKGAIREAAAALFLEKGYQGTSMDDVAGAAQISKQTIYTHFANKEELFADLVLGNAERVDEFVGTMAETIDGAANLEEGMR